MKKTVLLISILMGLIILTGCGNNGDQSAEQEVTPQTSQQNETQAEETDQDVTIEQQILLQQEQEALFKDAISGDLDLSKCDKLTNENRKNICIKDIVTIIAINNEDPSICDKLTNEEDKEYCVTKIPTVIEPPPVIEDGPREPDPRD